MIRFETIGYPGWQRYIGSSFSAVALVEELTAQIVSRVPNGAICVVGMSIGGHFGFAVARRLQSIGREVAGLCAIDSFKINSAAPSSGWRTRALTQGLELIRSGHIAEFCRFLRSRFWRLLLRLVGGGMPRLLRSLASSRRISTILSLDTALELEMNMRLLIRATAPWIASLDRVPAVLSAPAALLRTHSTASDDAIWRRRCPNIIICEIPGDHQTLFEPQNVGALRSAFIAVTRDWR